MKAATVKAPGGLQNIVIADIADPCLPSAREIRVALHASSLNFHYLLVANGGIPTQVSCPADVTVFRHSILYDKALC